MAKLKHEDFGITGNISGHGNTRSLFDIHLERLPDIKDAKLREHVKNMFASAWTLYYTGIISNGSLAKAMQKINKFAVRNDE